MEMLSHSCPGVSARAPLMHLLHTHTRTWCNGVNWHHSLHFTFGHYNHPQQQPQQRHEWYYSYSCVRFCFFFSHLGFNVVSLLSLLFESCRWREKLKLLFFLVFCPLAPHAALLEFCSAFLRTSPWISHLPRTILHINTGYFTSPYHTHTHTESDTSPVKSQLAILNI